jgi:spore maturation protein CgeB
VVFVGGLSHRQGCEPFVEPLLERLGERAALFVGPGWEKYGLPHQIVAYGELLNVIYNLGRVCINFHSAEQTQGERVRVDLNNRVFDLAMAGCLQVSDNTEGLRWHFREDEVVMAQTPNEWVDKVLAHIEAPEEQRLAIRQRARCRALADHTWSQRGRQLLDFIYLRLSAVERISACKSRAPRRRWFRSLFMD